MAGDFNERVARAMAAGKGQEAVALWRDLLTVTNVEEQDYGRCCRALADLYLAAPRKRVQAAAAIREYQFDLDGAIALYRQVGSVRDVGRLLMLKGDSSAALVAYRSANLTAHAAAAADAAALHADAADLWLSLVRPLDLQGDLYMAGLARFNAARSSERAQDKDAARLYFEAMNMLAAEADRRETAGDRDGAFRCFMVMKDVGVAARAFEDVAEGYLNMARLLRLKGDRFGTVQALNDVIRVAEEMGELHAASELYREAGEYARRMGFVYADHFLVQAGRSWRRVATEGARANRPQGIVENALLAAVDAYNRTLDHAEVARCYQALAALDLPAARRERYEQLATDLARLAGTPSGMDAVPALPDYFRRRFNPVDHAVKDLLDREAGVNVGVAAARLLTDAGVYDVGRRRALNVFLAWDDHVTESGPDAPLPSVMINLVGEARHPTLVPALADIFRRGTTEQKVAAVTSAARMKAREAIALVDQALAHPSSSDVYQAGLNALRGMTFPQALDALVRMFGHHDDRRVKEIALKNLALIGTAEAAEFLLDVVRTNTAQMGILARETLMTQVNEKMLGALENNYRGELNKDVRLFISQLMTKVRRSREMPI